LKKLRQNGKNKIEQKHTPDGDNVGGADAVGSFVTDRPNGATHVRLNGATFRVTFSPSNWVNY
jgi:hypothetical protein